MGVSVDRRPSLHCKGGRLADTIRPAGRATAARHVSGIMSATVAVARGYGEPNGILRVLPLIATVPMKNLEQTMITLKAMRRPLLALVLTALSAGAYAQPAATEYKPEVGQEGKDVVWVPT